MSKVRTVISSGVIAAGMATALAPTAVLAAPTRQTPDIQEVALQQPHAATLPPPALCILYICLGGGGGGGGGGGTSTPELPSSVLIAIGLLPPLVLGAMWRRGRRSK